MEKTTRSLIDQINKLWHTAEHDLQDVGLPVSTIISVSVNLGEYRVVVQFGWLRKYGNFRIVVQEPGGEAWRPILSCSLELRAELARHFPALKVAICCKKEELLPKLQEAIDVLSPEVSQKPQKPIKNKAQLEEDEDEELDLDDESPIDDEDDEEDY